MIHLTCLNESDELFSVPVVELNFPREKAPREKLKVERALNQHGVTLSRTVKQGKGCSFFPGDNLQTAAA